MHDLLLWNINYLFDLATGWRWQTGWRRTERTQHALPQRSFRLPGGHRPVEGNEL